MCCASIPEPVNPGPYPLPVYNSLNPPTPRHIRLRDYNEATYAPHGWTPAQYQDLVKRLREKAKIPHHERYLIL